MIRVLKVYWPYGLLALAVMLPLLPAGYILTLDAVFVPYLAAPAAGNSDFLWQWALHILNFVVPSEIIEKALFLGIILAAAITMHQLVVGLRATVRADKTLEWGAAPYLAGIFFAANPYTYDRFMAGQYGVLLGYALLPLAVRWLLEFAQQPQRREMARLAVLAAVIGIISVPTLGEFALAALCVLASAAWQQRTQPAVLRLYALRSLAALGLFLVLSSYWVVPLALGKGAIANSLQQFNAAHTAAFATVGTTFIAKLAAVLQLQGFWAERHHLFVLPHAQLPGWGTVRLVVWAGVIAGVVVCWRRARQVATPFLAMGAAGALLAAGLFAVPLTHLGYREPQKFAGLLAVAFAVFLAFTAARISGWARRRSETGQVLALMGIFLLVFLFTPTIYWGFAGQLRPRHYPAGWFTANAYLQRQPGAFNTVFLPWHQYMSFDFSGRIIANPAPRFFGGHIISSNDPELGAITPRPQAMATKVGRLLTSPPPPDIAVRLARYNVRYILVAKDYDYRHFDRLLHSPNVVLVQDTPSISVYENSVWKAGE